MSDKTKAPAIAERLSAAGRALAHRPGFNIRFGGNTTPNGINTDAIIALPLAEKNPAPEQLRRLRGEVDIAALALRHHNSAAHAEHRPNTAKAAAVYDALELMRIQLKGGAAMQGVAHNLDARMERYIAEQGYDRTSESADPPLADMLALLLRESATGVKPPASMNSLMKLWKPLLQSKTGATLTRMAMAVDNQRQFQLLMEELLEELDMIAQEGSESEHIENDAESAPGSSDEERSDESTDNAAAQTSPSFSPSGGDEQSEQSSQPSETGVQEDMQELVNSAQKPDGTVWLPNFPELEALKDSPRYRAYTRIHDEVVNAETLAAPEELARLRMLLDQKLENVRGVTSKLSARLQRLLMAKQARQWVFEQEEGILNNARLSRAIVNPNYPYLYKIETEAPFRDTVITLLLDNSGSMRGRPITVAAMSADILARTLERCGVKVEILGFTTRDWKGGLSRKQWQEAGRPADPGRLNDLRHIIYKSADNRWQKSKKNLGLMLKDGILKENIDGEAIVWAYERLIARPEQRRILMVISDGAPVDDSTLSVNHGNYLDSHLREVIAHIEARSDAELLAIGIGHDVTRYYKNAVTLTDVEQLGTIMISELTRLFSDSGNTRR